MLFCGLDVGSRTTKAVLVDETGAVRGEHVRDSGVDVARAACEVRDDALKQVVASPEDIARTLATGYGRRLVDFADDTVTEITCHARGARRLFPDARTVLDIGGQDSKIIYLAEDGLMRDFAMNDRCAAGTGRFIEAAGSILGIPLERMDAMARDASQAAAINSTCVVFAESEVIGLVAQGRPAAEILAGVCKALVRQVLTLTGAQQMVAPVIFTGGVALNGGMVRALTRAMDGEVRVPHSPQTVGALGAALIALEQQEGRAPDGR